jgi:hypothetical protein
VRHDVLQSGVALLEDLPRYALASTCWLLVMAVVLTLGRRQPAALVLAVALVPTAGGIGRMAARSARGERPTRQDFRDGVAQRPAASWSLGAVAVAVMLVTALNLSLSGGRTTLAVMSSIVSLHVAAATTAIVASVWPLLMDPARDGIASRAVVRQGLVVLAVHPRAVAALVAMEFVLALAQLTVLATAFVLPAVMVLVATFVVVPRADRVVARLRSVAP